MSYHKLIHDYLAGDLSRKEEEKLFDGLSRHGEWREEMQLQLRLERAMEHDLHSVTVPPHTSNAVFASLGFRRPSKWSRPALRGAVLRPWPARTTIVTGIAGMVLLTSSAYFILRSNKVAQFPRPVALVPEISLPQPLARNSELNVERRERGTANAALLAPVALRSSPLTIRPKPASIVSDSSGEASHAAMPNERLRHYFDIGNLYSVHYLTLQKIIGVSDHGQIFVSEDGGHSWALQTSGVHSDLYGVHFIDTSNGIAVGSQGTILLTSDAGQTWRRVESGTTTTLSTVRYVTHDTIYICGESGTMLRSTTGGSGWQVEQTGIHANLFRMAFENGVRGEVYGAGGSHISTINGGETWNIIK